MDIRSTTTRILALGLAGALAMTACVPREEEPMNENSTQHPSDTAQRSGEVIRKDFLAEVERLTQTAGGTWTYMDDRAFAATDRDSYFPQPCTDDDQGPQQLQLMLKSEPRKDGPAEIEAMRGKLEDAGWEISGFIPSKASDVSSTVGAQRADGSQVTFSTNEFATTLRLASECSSHPSMSDDIE